MMFIIGIMIGIIIGIVMACLIIISELKKKNKNNKE